MVKKVSQCRKPKKRSFRLIKRFLQTENKKMQGVPSDKIRKFSKKSRIVPEKNTKGGPFGLTCTFGSTKKLWFSARIEPTLSGFRTVTEVD